MKLALFALALMIPVLAVALPEDATLHPSVRAYIDARLQEVDDIPEERKAHLREIAAWVEARVNANEPAKLTFICTHNSRRSHMSQIWAQAAAAHFRLPGVEAYSGGTEATAFNPRAVAALERAGFAITKTSNDENPRYDVSLGDGIPTLTAYSKLFIDPANPQQDFVAVMTCSQADEACPYVRGAALRVSIPYDDPKAFDGTELEAAKYDERSRQIAREILYLFSLVGSS